MVWDVFRTVSIPIIGMGGIMDSDDAIEYLIAGATAVAVGTANFINPRATTDVIDGIKQYMRNYQIEDITTLRGSLQ
jgi:dihydroorotate dehydrogenase (NAD+) catalytic subunit